MSGLSERAVRGWVRALPAPAYEVAVVPGDGESGSAERRRVSGDGVLRILPWLRARNAAGAHVYARPANPAFVLVDDLDPDALDVLTAAGHRPAAVVLTSPYNHQVWLALGRGAEGDAALTPALSSAVARVAARRFGGDPGAASAAQHGRLPGLCNRKATHADHTGRGPYVLLVAAAGGVDPGAGALLAAAREELAVREAKALAPSRPPRTRRARLRPCTPAQEWAAARLRVEGACIGGQAIDRSRLDFAVAARLLGRGASEAYVRDVLLAGERARGMRGAAAEAYVARTVAAAAMAQR
ncbi:DNA-primase RepB domain-containing protein [Roseomonas sp. GCM10028921]